MTSTTAATTPARPVHPARRWSQLLVGLVLYGVAIGLMISANVGLDPWTVFAQGWSRTVGIPIGIMTVLIGIGVLLLWIPLKQRPGIGTVLNVIVIGPVIDLTLLVVDTPDALIARWVVFLGGLALLALATGLYIGAGFGPGPRDGLMTGAHARFGWPVWAVRTGVEVTVLATGWMLGGTVGLGTVAFALLIGPMVGVTLPRLRLPEAPRRQRGSVRSTDASHPVPGGTGGGA
ncbi:putative membrane protein YczE [Microcella alkaliphila]|uniref:Putative membrane protein YczE n=1 Tax=Microcella alkaliphila TaxID=279828 RepID=A0A4Q7TJR1_9MICO|nr:hypothetical protein [Microcella alkaliphila]RZT60874.1 putative membrane protein YczE [Microcella alkaliphila]